MLQGWFVENRTKSPSELWVLNPKGLPTFIEHEPVQLKPEDVALVSSRIIAHMQEVVRGRHVWEVIGERDCIFVCGHCSARIKYLIAMR